MNLVKLDSISKTYGETIALEGVSFEIKAGEIHGILGPNGAGKTTLLKLISGLLAPELGEIYLQGQKFTPFVDNQKESFGTLLEQAPLYYDMSVQSYLRFSGELRGLKKDKLKESLEFVIDKLGLETVRNRLIKNLSRGFKQRVGIAQAIVHRPKIVILDEPTLGLDPKTVVEIRELIVSLKKDHTIILSSHVLHEVNKMCDSLTILSKGEVIASGGIDEVKRKIQDSKKIKIESLKSHESFLAALSEMKELKIVESNKVDNLFVTEVSQNMDTELRHILVKKAVEHDIDLITIKEQVSSLEDVFLKVTKE